MACQSINKQKIFFLLKKPPVDALFLQNPKRRSSSLLCKGKKFSKFHNPKTPPKYKKLDFYAECLCGQSLAQVMLGPKKLRWAYPSQPRDIFPMSQLPPVPSSGSELQGSKMGIF